MRTSRRSLLLSLARPYALAVAIAAALAGPRDAGAEEVLVFAGEAGPGLGKHVVLIAGDEEYRSEEALPQLARILATHHGFRCTVLFSIDPESGAIDPEARTNLPGTGALAGADLLVIFTRFRDLPDEQMQPIVDYVEAGRPVVGLRTATHAFAFERQERYRHWSWNSREWDGGFGRQVLGETWIAHHGAHGRQSARGIVPDGLEHPILRGIRSGDVWDPADVYAVRLPMLPGVEPVLLGEVVEGMSPDDPPARPTGEEGDAARDPNDPMMPIAWTRHHRSASGVEARVFCTTVGCSQSLLREGTRRLLVNACYWALGMEAAIPERAEVGLVGSYEPTPFGFGTHRRGVRPSDLRE